MAFRDERAALRTQKEALAERLRERELEVARLEGELQRARGTLSPQERADARRLARQLPAPARAQPELLTAPRDADLWVVDARCPSSALWSAWLIGIALMGLPMLFLSYLSVETLREAPELGTMALFMAIGVWIVSRDGIRRELVVNRVRRTVTLRRGLGIKVVGPTIGAGDGPIDRFVSTSTSKEHGTTTHSEVWLRGFRLASCRGKHGVRLAQELARFLGVPERSFKPPAKARLRAVATEWAASFIVLLAGIWWFVSRVG